MSPDGRGNGWSLTWQSGIQRHRNQRYTSAQYRANLTSFQNTQTLTRTLTWAAATTSGQSSCPPRKRKHGIAGGDPIVCQAGKAVESMTRPGTGRFPH